MEQNNQDNSGVESEINGSAEAESNTNIQSRNIFDLSGVPNTETSIDLNQMRVDTIPDLSRFKDLEFLGLRQNLLTSLNTNISLLINLTELELYDNQLTEIQGIENLINLEILDLSYNRIGKIKGISTLSKLRKLFLINNKIEQIEGLEGLILLELLELGDNKIKEISNLNHLINLQELFLGKNKIKKIEGIDSLVKLRVLSLPANRLTKLEGLENLVELEELHINDQGIESLNGIKNQVHLQLLDAAANSISDYLRHAINEWKNMPVKEKLIWTKKSDKDKRRYQREIVEYYKLKYQNVEEQFE
uniref:High mobility group box domain-containing protein n=1 Tax=Meloidogyne javanica TaxID=6303 RepID=A0A915N2K8_MELJA